MKKIKLLIKILILVSLNLISNIFFLVPRKKIFLFIGKNNCTFLDNVKYIFLFKEKKIRKYLLICDKYQFIELKKVLNDKVIYIFSLKGLYFLIFSKYFIVDNINWSIVFKGFIYFFSKGAKKIQLWHGYPIKKIEYDNKYDLTLQRCKVKKSLKDWVLYFENFNRCIKYDFLLIPSKNKYFTKIFQNSFEFKKSIIIGYPRNEFLLFPDRFEKWENFLNQSLYNKINYLKSNFKIIGFLPTFRDDMSIFLDKEDLVIIDKFAKDNNVYFVFKPHPWDKRLENFLRKNNFTNILFLNRFEDIYPYLKFFDLLISDISSITFDFLLLDKPIIHFFPDKISYVNNMRDLYFDFDEIKVGIECDTITELCAKIMIEINEDNFKLKRENIKKFVFGNVLHNSELIYKEILKHV